MNTISIVNRVTNETKRIRSPSPSASSAWRSIIPLWEVAPSGWFAYDMGHRLLYANPAMRSLTRKSVEVGCVDFLLDVAPGAGRAVRRGFLEVQKGARSSYSRIVPLVVRDRSIPVRLSMTLFGNASDEPVVLGSVTRMFSVRADQSVDEEALESAERAIERIMVEVAAVLPDAAPAATTLQFDDLSVRQNEILGLILAGHDIESISHRLHLSQHTVRNHTQAILRCLGVHSKVDLIAYCRSVKPTPVDALFSPPR